MPNVCETLGVCGTQITRVTFTADKAGMFKMKCNAHSPSLQADLVVLPGK